MARRTRGDRAQLVVIWWRDIPAQVNAQVGRERHQVVLGGKFQRAIDRAKRKAGIVTADDDVSQWRRETELIEGDPRAAADATAQRLEDEYDRLRLGRLAMVGGFEADFDSNATFSVRELADLEELDDQADAQEDAT